MFSKRTDFASQPTADLIRASHLEIGVTGTCIAVVAFREVVPDTNPPVHVGTNCNNQWLKLQSHALQKQYQDSHF